LKHFEKHEKHVQELLGLDATIASGSKFHDPGDGVSRNHYLDEIYRLYAEAKCTEQKSFSLKREDVASYAQRAREYGKTFCMPIRFVEPECYTDYVVLRLEDFAEILSLAQSHHVNQGAANYMKWIISKIGSPEIRREAQQHLDDLTGET
jgi:hypothetical protein